MARALRYDPAGRTSAQAAADQARSTSRADTARRAVVANVARRAAEGTKRNPLEHTEGQSPVAGQAVSATQVESGSSSEVTLRRAVGPWGSYTWGYADVGADVYVALGLVMAAAQGLTNVAFLFAGLVYVCIGLAYTELSSAYPLAGGGQFFVLRGLGDFWGFVAGWAVLLDFTIDISLFALSSAGYISFFVPALKGTATLSIAGLTFNGTRPWLILLATGLVVALTALNIKGVRESTRFNEFLGALDVSSESAIIFLGFLLAFDPGLLVHQMVNEAPSAFNLAYGASLAIISFVGLESISQASQETVRPSTVVPRTSIGLIVTVLIYALAFSNLGLGMLPWQSFAARPEDPIAWLASHVPFLGLFAGFYVAALGATLVLISSNAGIFGSSRITYSMARYGLLPKWFAWVHPRTRTPVRTLVTFSGLALVELWLAGLSTNALNALGNMYAFGAASAYLLVFVSLFVLRRRDPYTPRPFRVPLNVGIRGSQYPIVGVLGVIGIASILIMVVLTHEIGRIAGPAWVIVGIVIYAVYRRHQHMPILGNIPRHWEEDVMAVYRDSGEQELVDEYSEALGRARRKHTKGQGEAHGKKT